MAALHERLERIEKFLLSDAEHFQALDELIQEAKHHHHEEKRCSYCLLTVKMHGEDIQLTSHVELYDMTADTAIESERFAESCDPIDIEVETQV